MLLCSMAVADLLVGAISMQLTVATDTLIIHQVNYFGFCTLRVATESSMFTLIWSSLYHLTLISWERYVAIRKSIDYETIVTRGLLKRLAIVAWALTAFTSFPPLVMIVVGVDQKIKKAWHISESVVSAVCLAITGYFYIMVYLGVRKRKLNQISQVTTLIKAKQESKVAKTTGLITAALIVSFVPIIVFGGLREVSTVLPPSLAFRLPKTLLMLNSLANALIYFYRDRCFRNAALELLRVRRPPTQPAGGALQIVRRNDPFASLKGVPKRIKEEQHAKRAASGDPAAISDCIDGQFYAKVFLERSMSAPNLDKYNSSTDDLRIQAASSMVVTTATIHTESRGRYQANINNRVILQIKVKVIGKGQRQRSRSLDVRRNDPFASLEGVPKRKKEEQHVKRAASGDPAATSDCIDGQSHAKVFLERSMSVPNLDKYNSSTDDLRIQAASSMVVTTATSHTESRGRYQANINNRVILQDASKHQETGNRAQCVRRSRSWDACDSEKCANHISPVLISRDGRQWRHYHTV